MIEHLRPELTESAPLRLHPGSGWVTVHLGHPEAGDLVLTLVSLALAATTVVKTDHLTWRAPCPATSNADRRTDFAHVRPSTRRDPHCGQPRSYRR